MKRLLLLLVFFVIQGIAYSQSNEEILNTLQKELKVAVENENYSLASSIKEEIEIRKKIKFAVENEDFEKAAALKKELIPVDKQKVKTAEKSEPKTVETVIIPNAVAVTTSKFTKFSFPVNIDKSVVGEFPSADTIDGYQVYPIGIIQGIEVGFTIDIDADNDIDGGYTDRYITLILRNKTGKEIVLNNAMDKLMEVKFTGEKVEYDIDAKGDFYREKLGSKCPFYAFALDEENGKFVMEPDEVYEWDYVVSQESETAVGSFLERRFKVIWLKSFIPSSHTGDFTKTEFPFFPSLKLDKFPQKNEGSFSVQKVELPGKRIESTTAIRGLSLVSPLSRDGQFTVAFENENMKVLYKVNGSKFNKDYGYLTYEVDMRIVNLKDQVLYIGGYGKHGYLAFYNGVTIPIKFHTLPPRGSYDKTVELNVLYFSGELWDGKSYSNRNIEGNRPLVPNYIKLKSELLWTAKDLSEKTADGSTKINMFMKPAYISSSLVTSDLIEFMARKKYNNNNFKFLLHMGVSETNFRNLLVGSTYAFSYSNGGKKDLFFTYKKPLTIKKINKLISGGTSFSGSYIPINAIAGYEVYYILGRNSEKHAVPKHVFDKYVAESKVAGQHYDFDEK